MMLVASGVKVHIALGVTDMRKGLDGLAPLVQEVLRQDPFSGHLFAFRGRKANLIKIVFWDGTGLCLFSKRLEEGRFQWPGAEAAGDKGGVDLQAAIDADRGHRLAGARAPMAARRGGVRRAALAENNHVESIK